MLLPLPVTVVPKVQVPSLVTTSPPVPTVMLVPSAEIDPAGVGVTAGAGAGAGAGDGDGEAEPKVGLKI
jgi:hypothetical protein